MRGKGGDAFTLSMSSVICSRDSLVPPGLSGNMERLRATRMRVEMILLLALSESFTVILLGSMRSDAVPYTQGRRRISE